MEIIIIGLVGKGGYMNVKTMSTKALKKQYLELDDMINNVGCYSVRDLVLMEAMGEELYNRGVEVAKKAYFVEEDL